MRENSQVISQVKTLNSQVIQLPAPISRFDAVPDDAIVVLPLKAHQIISALDSLAPHLKSSQSIVLLHNGMLSDELLKPFCEKNAIFRATTSYAARKQADATTITGHGETAFGIASPRVVLSEQDDIDSVQTVMSRLIPPVTYSGNIREILWKKLIINAAINPITALFDIKNGELAQPQYANTITALISEALAVALSEGLNFNLEEATSWVYTVIEQTAENYSSMHQDIAAQRQTEVDYINGYIAQEGLKKGIDVSVNASMVAQIKQRNG